VCEQDGADVARAAPHALERGEDRGRALVLARVDQHERSVARVEHERSDVSVYHRDAGADARAVDQRRDPTEGRVEHDADRDAGERRDDAEPDGEADEPTPQSLARRPHVPAKDIRGRHPSDRSRALDDALAAAAHTGHSEIAMIDGDGERWEAAQEGAERVREGDLDGAIEELERVVAEDPGNPYAFFFLGSAHFEKGNFEKAMKAYVVALDRAPDYLGAMVHLGHTLRMLGRYDQALRMGREVLSRDANDAEALHLMGLTHYARGDEAAAAGYLRRFLDTRPELEVAQEARGLLEILEGRIEPLT
jgi:tetratricopeptide (TPR) repeat protein